MDSEFITAPEAADLLGVDVATVYSYVSRKGIRSAPIAGSRHRRYWRADIERLRRRRSRSEPAGDLNRESEITLLTARGPFYRGRSAVELAAYASLEEVASLLWGVAGAGEFTPPAPRGAPAFLALDAALKDHSVADRAAAMFPVLEQANPRAYDLTPEGMARTGADVMRWLAAIMLHRSSASAEPFHLVFADVLGLSPALADLVRRLLVLSADHAFEPTTFAVRAVASAGVTPWRAVMTGLSVATGRHSRFESFDALRLFVSEVTEGADPSAPVLRRLRAGEAVPGFASAVYADGDPRGRDLLKACAAIMGDDVAFQRLAAAIGIVKEVTGQEPNFALVSRFTEDRIGIGSSASRVGLSSTEAPFLLGRSAGWIAHAIEQYRIGEAGHRGVHYKGALPA